MKNELVALALSFKSKENEKTLSQIMANFAHNLDSNCAFSNMRE